MKALLLLVMSVLGPSKASHGGYNENDVKYTFSWSVRDDYSGNDFGHSENRAGADTSGTYHVLLPDGRVQTVTYSVDRYSGFQARVIYDRDNPDGPANRAHPVTTLNSHPTHPSYPSYGSASSYINPYAYSNPSQAGASPEYLQPHQPPISQPPPAPAYATYNQETYNYLKSAGAPAVAGGYQPVAPAASATSYYPVYTASHPHHPSKSYFFHPAPGLTSPNDIHTDTKTTKKEKDPYLRTEAELAGKDFDKPFYYPYKRKIKAKGRAKKTHSRI